MTTARRRAAGPLLLLVLAALVALGTAMWIAGLLRPIPSIAPGVVRGAFRHGDALVQVVDLPRATPFDAAGASVLQTARLLASGRVPAPAPRVLAFDFQGGDAAMRLVFDAGVIAAGAASGAEPDHMLGLAGAGSRWPARGGAALDAYCGRMETMRKPFCTRSLGRAAAD